VKVRVTFLDGSGCLDVRPVSEFEDIFVAFFEFFVGRDRAFRVDSDVMAICGMALLTFRSNKSKGLSVFLQFVRTWD